MQLGGIIPLARRAAIMTGAHVVKLASMGCIQLKMISTAGTTRRKTMKLNEKYQKKLERIDFTATGNDVPDEYVEGLLIAFNSRMLVEIQQMLDEMRQEIAELKSKTHPTCRTCAEFSIGDDYCRLWTIIADCGHYCADHQEKDDE